MNSRIGGDEFVILLTELMDFDSLVAHISQLMAIYDTSIHVSNGESLRITGSLGIAIYPDVVW